MAEVKSVLPSVINDGTAISVDELNKVLASLKQQRDIIKNEYNTNIRSIIEDSRSCISVSGLDIEKVLSAFTTTFENLDKNFDALINVLENNVIKNYSELARTIQQMFGTQFADKLSSLLGLK